MKPKESLWIKAVVPGIKPVDATDRIMIRPLDRQKKFFDTPCALLDERNRNLLLVNRTDEPVRIMKNEIVANAEIIENPAKSQVLEKPCPNSHGKVFCLWCKARYHI